MCVYVCVCVCVCVCAWRGASMALVQLARVHMRIYCAHVVPVAVECDRPAQEKEKRENKKE